MGELHSGRSYTPEELHAAKILQLAGFDSLIGDPGRGPLYFATGDFWIEKVEVYGAKYEAAARAASVLADAMRREFCAWPVDISADPTGATAARQHRDIARKRITELNAELTRLISASTRYVPGETVLLSHPAGDIEATIINVLPDGYTYLLATKQFGEVQMEARYFKESSEAGSV